MNQKDTAIRDELAAAIFWLIKEGLAQEYEIHLARSTNLAATITIRVTPESKPRNFVLRLREL